MEEKSKDIPLYLYFAEKFKQKILSGELRPGDQFPPEIKLAKKYGVARVTIRNAINVLVQEKLIIRLKGKGSFVAEPKIERELVNVASFTERMQSRGMRAGALCHEVKLIKADTGLSQQLHIDLGSEVVEIVRIRLTNDNPVAIEKSYLPRDLCPGIEKENLEDNSLYYILDSKYSLQPAHSSKTIELARATLDEAKLLHIPKGTPLFLIRATVFTQTNQVMEFVNTLFLGDKFRFQVY
ncbi:GntR family transcriptional regulator [Heyndrickxia coagulans]|uniref:GntR family transcriptional regulator n=1 Tax=Heyndrickxia TaxID=2837504 RepID=UPI0021B231D8|nr:GntR family transcriptional regulator [Heyndrickxia coagulans]UXC22780.1 GntR family transcriptional regulator [Heyndrickxia coagulans]